MIRSLLMPALFVVASMLAAPVILAQEPESAKTQDVKIEIAQANTVKSNEAAAKPLQPKWTDYKGVRVGMSADEVRAKLANLKDKGKVQAISINYVNTKSAPDAVAVLGEEVQAQADGSMYKLVRYPEAGYWVAYSRTSGDSPLTTVTIQKMQ